MRGCYPGSFDPLTVAHVAIAAAAVEQCGLESLDFVVSEVALTPRYGGSIDARDAALRRLPPLVAIAPRAGADDVLAKAHAGADAGARVVVLDLPAWIADVSSSAVRAGAHHWRAAGRAHDEPQTRQDPE